MAADIADEPLADPLLRPSAVALLHVALVMWSVSLVLPVFEVRENEYRWWGAYVLLSGWFPIHISWPWLANPLLLWAGYRLQAQKTATGISLLALLLALPSGFALRELSIYGYGWGYVLWLTAFMVLVSAAGTRQRELRIASGTEKEVAEWLRPVGMGLAGLMLGASVYWAVQDRWQANAVEREHLAGLAFKSGEVCSVPPPSVPQPLAGTTGALEIIYPQGLEGIRSPFTHPTVVLDWGIPVVRVSGRDYSYVVAERERILTSTPASGAVAASLSVSGRVVVRTYHMNLKLEEKASGRTIFDQTWQGDVYSKNEAKNVCPAYSVRWTEDLERRTLLIQGLGKLVSEPIERPKVAHSYPSVKGRVVSRSGEASSSEQDERPDGERSSSASVGNRMWSGNRHCPADIGWQGPDSKNRPGKSPGWPFMLGERAYHLLSHYGKDLEEGMTREENVYNVLCKGAHAYIFSGSKRGPNGYSLKLQKRGLSDFRWMGEGFVTIEDATLVSSPGRDFIKIDAILEDGDGITMTVVNEVTQRTAVITAPLKLLH